MLIVALKSTEKHMWYITAFSAMFCYVRTVFCCHACNLITIFSTAFCNVTPVTLLLSFNKKGPGGYLIRVDLIRFPGSIPGAVNMFTS